MLFNRLGGLVDEPGRAQIIVQRLRLQHQWPGDVPVADDAARGLAREGRNLAFQLAHAGLAGVIVDDAAQSWVGEFHLLFGQAMLFQLARHQVAFGDLQLFRLRVAGQLDHFEPVAQRRMNRLQPIGCSDEQHPRKVERQI